jgi:hypothetical protein
METLERGVGIRGQRADRGGTKDDSTARDGAPGHREPLKD